MSGLPSVTNSRRAFKRWRKQTGQHFHGGRFAATVEEAKISPPRGMRKLTWSTATNLPKRMVRSFAQWQSLPAQRDTAGSPLAYAPGAALLATGR